MRDTYTLPNITYVDTYIDDGNQAIYALKNFYDTMLIGDIDNKNHIIRVPIYDFFLKYRSQLEECVQYFNLPEIFFYKPKSLSFELYESTEMWLALLRLNAMRSIIEFNQPLIKVYNPHQVRELIDIFFRRDNIYV